jgi:hypothetical protein
MVPSCSKNESVYPAGPISANCWSLSLSYFASIEAFLGLVLHYREPPELARFSPTKIELDLTLFHVTYTRTVYCTIRTGDSTIP